MAAFRLISCDRCGRKLYQTDGEHIRAPEGELLPTRPVHFVIANRRVITCSSECASRWIYSKPTEELLGGFPLF